MNRTAAEEITALVLRQARELRESVQRIRDTEQREEVAQYRDAVAKILEEMLMGILTPIFDEHPDLKPPKLL
jgi:DNA-binding protein H-NS